MKRLFGIIVFSAGLIGISGCTPNSNVAGLASSSSTSAPSAPTGLSVSGISSSSLTLTWTPTAAASTVLYQVQQCSGSGCTSFADVSNSPLNGTATSITISGLSSATIYVFRVRATNSFGSSTYLTSGDVTTSAVTVNAPSSLAATAQNTTSIALGWVDNATNETGYQVQMCTGVACSVFADVPGSPFAANTTAATVSGLTASTVYGFQVRAVSSGSNSAYVPLANIETAPAAPTAMVVGAITATSIALSWTDNASDATGYQFQSCAGAGCTNFVDVAGSPLAIGTTSIVESSLTENAVYNFRVRAVNTAGNSPWLTSGNVSTIIAAPTSLVVGTITDTTVQLSWTDNSTTALIYQIQSCTGAGCSAFTDISQSPVLSTATGLTITGLTQATTYVFQLRAVNSSGHSTFLTSGNITTLPTSVLAPSSLTISAVTSTSVSLSWVDNAGNATGYEVDKCSGAACTTYTAVVGSPFGAGATSATISGLTASSTYRFQVRALTASTQSAFVSTNYVTTPPAAPTALVAGAVTPSSIAFSWTNNAIDALIYNINQCTGSGCSTFATASGSPEASSATSFTATGLTENTTYNFEVAAANSNGSSSFLTSGNMTTAMSPPVSFVETSATDTSVTFSWTNVSASATLVDIQDCTGSGCVVFASVPGSPFAGGTTSTTVTGLTASTFYNFRVRADNGVVQSMFLNSGNIKTGPAAPTAFVLGAVTSSSVILNWTNNAVDATNYQIQRCTGTGCTTGFTTLTSSLSPAATSFTDSTVAGSTTYVYRITTTNSNGTSNFLSSGNVTTLATAVLGAACTSPNTTIVDYGVKNAGAIATSERGLWSDMKYIPTGVTTAVSAVAGQPNGNIVTYGAPFGVAYADTGSQSLKYTYWNGGEFHTEVVMGDSIADMSYVVLAYLSNSPNKGIPMIFWQNGSSSGNIMMAVRSTASLTSAGTWTVTAIDNSTVVSNRALAVSVNPNDQVILAYAVTTPLIRFVYCTSNCNNPSNYVTMAAGASVDNGLAFAGQNQIGLAWCQSAAGVYNPQITYSVSNVHVEFAGCMTFSTTPTNCLTNGNWTKTTAFITLGTANGLNDNVYLDPSILKDTPKFAVHDNGTGISEFSLSSTCDTLVAGSTFTAVGATNEVGAGGVTKAGNSYIKILKTSDYTTLANDRYYIVYNDDITDIRWAASSSSNFQGAWLTAATAASSIQNNVALLAAAGTTTFGADLSTSTGQLTAAYGTSIAGFFNLNLGVVSQYLFPNGDPSTVATDSYYQIPIETNGAMQLNATQFSNTAIAYTSNNIPAVAYVDFSSGVSTTGKLKYALRSSSAFSASSWSPIAVPGINALPGPQFPSLAFDNNNLPWIGYWDSVNLRFVLATNTQTNGEGIWTNYSFPVKGGVNNGAPAAQPAGNATAVAMFVSGGVFTPVMIVIDNTTTLTKAVKSAMLNPATGVWTTPTQIVALAAGGADFLSADWNTAGTIAVAYQNLGAGAVRVMYAASTNGGATWPTNASAPIAVSSLNMGEGVTLKLNPVTNLPSISYYNMANNKIFFASCTANCTGTSAPAFSGTGAAAVLGLGISGLAATNVNLLNSGLNFDSSGNAYLLHNSGATANGDLQIVNNIGGTMPSGTPTAVVSGANGSLSALAPAATNGGIPWGQSVVRAPNGNLGAVYNSPGNFLGVTTCGD